MNKLTLPKGSTMSRPDFVYGVATAAFQIEGGAETRLPCIWDTFCQQDGKVKDQSDGLVACDHYNLWQEDIELIESLDVDAYRLSISWPRVITESGELNPVGVEFYLKILDTLNQKGIKPFVTLYHWDLPQHIEDKGGWLNRETAFLFADYADKISRAFGDRVYSYATLNEPFCSAYLGYEWGIHAPGYKVAGDAKKATHHLLLAHGLAMQKLTKNSPQSLNGIVLNFSPCYPQTESEEDQAAAHLADLHYNQWFIQPLIEGQYPTLPGGSETAHQPLVEAGDLEIIAQPLDFIGVNYYTRTVYQADKDKGFNAVEVENVETTAMGWEIYPQGLTDLLVSLNQRYQLPPLYITENGAAFDDRIDNHQVVDTQRFDYLQSHLNAVNNAINQGVDIRGYFAWSLLDNFEWAEGYLKRFGIVYVDYQSQQRTLKNSGIAFQALLKNRTQS